MNDQQPQEVSEATLFDKVRRFALAAGGEVIEKALLLHFAAQSPNTLAWARAVIYGAVGYFVLPLDAVPDLIPLAGFTDDLGALTAAAATVVAHIDDDVREKARATRERLIPGQTDNR